jgi:nitrogen fixation-related uncharacterized protein
VIYSLFQRSEPILPHRVGRGNFPGAVSPVACYILAICLVGAVLAGAAFVWAALRGEFTDAAQAAFLVFDDDDPNRPSGPPR